MTPPGGETHQEKISAEFASRLARLGPEDSIRAVVMLPLGETGNRDRKRQNRAERQAAIKATRETASQAFEELGEILKHLGGKCLSDSPDALGSVLVETTGDGVCALAASDNVRAILEDQAVHRIP